MMSLTTIYVPTWGRYRIRTTEQMGYSLRKRTILCTTPEWARELRAHNDPSIYGVRIEHIGSDKGASTAKHNILSMSKDKSVVILDDDLIFQTSEWIRTDKGDKKRFRKSTPEQLELALNRLCARSLMKGVGFTSFSTPFFNRTLDEWGLCKFPNASIVINRSALRSTGATFAGIGTREDVQFAVMTWRAAYASYNIMTDAIVNGGDSSVGGESSIHPVTGYQTIGTVPRGKRTEDAHRLLAFLYSKYVKLITGVNNARMREVGTDVDIRVYGLKMYRDACKREGIEPLT